MSYLELFQEDLGDEVISIRFLQEFGGLTEYLDTEKIHELWQEYQKHDALFSDYTQGKVEPFLEVLVDDRSVWFEVFSVTEDKPIGVMMISNVTPGFDARGHFAFWDSRGSGREILALKLMQYFFNRYSLHRITARIPPYQKGVIRWVKRLGFKKEGEIREGTVYKGNWVPLEVFGILRRELNELMEESDE